MMKICSFGIFLITVLVVSASVCAETTPLATFIAERGGSSDIITKLDSKKPYNECLETPSYLICLESKYYPGLSTNTLSRNAMLQAIGQRIKYNLYQYLLSKISINNLLNKNIAEQAYLSGISSGNSHFLLKNVEFKTAFNNGFCQGVASVPIKSSSDLLQSKMSEPYFIKKYCQSLYPQAKYLMEKGEINKALEALKELHDLKFADVDAYLMAIRLFLINKEQDEARKIAVEILGDLKNKLSSEQAEKLGDIFMKLKMDKQAQESYEISSNLLTNNPQ